MKEDRETKSEETFLLIFSLYSEGISLHYDYFLFYFLSGSQSFELSSTGNHTQATSFVIYEYELDEIRLLRILYNLHKMSYFQIKPQRYNHWTGEKKTSTYKNITKKAPKRTWTVVLYIYNEVQEKGKTGKIKEIGTEKEEQQRVSTHRYTVIPTLHIHSCTQYTHSVLSRGTKMT